MRKILTILLLLILFTGCKKNGSAPFQNYIRFKVNRVLTECNAHIKATYLPPTIGPDNIITISGNWADGSIELHLNENSVLTARQYLFEPFTWRTADLRVTSAVGTNFSAGSCLGCATVTGSGKIIFTELNAEYVKGTFEFVTGVQPFIGGSFRTVTDGEFHIKRG